MTLKPDWNAMETIPDLTPGISVPHNALTKRVTSRPKMAGGDQW